MVRMSFFKDVHKGKRIWVCGTGPSLLDVDVTKLADDDVIIACNSAVKHFANPDYMLVVDKNIEKRDYYINQNAKEVILLNDQINIKPSNAREVFFQSSLWGDWGVYDYKHFPGNSTHRAVSFAFCMGARAIILAGCDATGIHPYAPEEDNLKQPFEEDIMLWNEMLRSNAKLRLYTISPFMKTFIPAKRFDQALML
jgi:hypothetical protein